MAPQLRVESGGKRSGARPVCLGELTQPMARIDALA